MKISIIIPAFNAGKTINCCLESIISQTYENIEIIVINDGSKDNTQEIVKRFSDKDSRIQIIDQKNSGIYISRKNGFNSSIGDAIFFIDADDFLEINAIELLVNVMVQKYADIVIGNHFHHENGRKNKIFHEIPANQTKLNLLKYLLLGKIKGYVWSKLFKRHLMEVVNLSKDFLIADDVLINFQIICNKDVKIELVDNAIYNYTIHGENTILSNKTKYIEGIYDHIEIVDQMINETGLTNQLHDELSAYKCRAWVQYSRKGGEKSKDKAIYKAFLNQYYPYGKKHIPIHQRIELNIYKRNYKLGILTTKSMRWIKNKLSI